MNILDLIGRKKKSSGEVAKDRLQLLLISDRTSCSPEIMQAIREDIVKVISKYMDIETEDIDIQITNADIDGNRQSVPTLFANIPIRDIKQGSGNRN